ncbi:hypothetical protein T440DRAFT_462809 [Plenodomus tracheiphilus IPT5]|uniref:Uncharacterized protein n=1 Tax=Plenodomus tracheiphilus IPT5 TaxID=1408161 RepID=A0A6A7BQD4_9PLEO|nr:hypothetical protein T440DRAFT_462809 [Plenodomus tracheiphilus IPT5]
MWAPNRAGPGITRTPSVQSVASFHSNSRSISLSSPHIQRASQSYDSDNFSDTASEDSRANFRTMPDSSMPPMWREQTRAPVNASTPHRGGNERDVAVLRKLQQQEVPRTHQIDDDATSRSSTLDGNEDDHYPQKLEKMPAALAVRRREVDGNEPASPAPAPHVPGPLESQLAALMSKLIYIEQENHAVSVTPEEYKETLARLKALEEEKKTWWKRHEAIWALRDEDVENNIKIRGLLAKTRRELEATKVLRDEDLVNVQLVRSKLAEKTREVERLQAQAGRSSPNRRPGSYLERRGTIDLFTAAKVAALEQRALELEKRNSDLVEQLGGAPSGGAMNNLNRTVAHEAWKDTVTALEEKMKAKDAEIAQLRSSSSAGGGRSAGASMDWYRIEALLEEHASYRESVGGRLQALRTEKEVLLKDLHQKENTCQALELKVQTLQRRANVI